MIELSVVVPMYNEKDNIARLHMAITHALAHRVEAYEIILVDDGSTDGSAEQLDQLALADPNVRIVHFLRNCGQSAAIASGLKAAKGRLIALMDGDLQTYPEDIFDLMPYMTDYDFANGTRVRRQDNLVRKVSSKVGNGIRNWITGDRIKDTGCPMKLFKREVAGSFTLYTGFHRFLPTLARMNGFRVIEVPVRHRERVAGTSKYGVFNRAFVGLMDAIVIGWMRRRSFHYQVREE